MRRLPVAAFAVLAALTVAAFFITQHLKTATPLVLSPGLGVPGPDPAGINPTKSARFCLNHEHVRVRFDKTHLAFKLEHASEKVEVYVVDSSGDVVDTLSSGRYMRKGAAGDFAWDGRNSSGQIVRDGTYYFRITLANGGGEELTASPISVITKDPRPVITGVRPKVIEPGSGDVTTHFKTDNYKGGTVLIYRTTASGRLTLVRSYTTNAKTGATAPWKGMIGLAGQNKPAPAGTYMVGLRVEDAACNLGTTPPTTDVVPGTTPGMGVTVRYLAALPPLTATAGGNDATVYVDARQHAYKWALRAAGATKELEHGAEPSGASPALQVRIPRGGPGLYELTVTSGQHRTTVPLAASASGHAASARVLVVLPMLTWHGNDPVDDNGDGLPDTLAAGDPVDLQQPLVSGLPAGFGDDAKLLAYLDSQHISYQLTTDVALARGEGPSLSGRRGVLLDGSFTWLPSSLAPQLRAYVKGGGHVATIGLNTLERQAKLVSGPGGTLRTGRPAPLQPDPFGARHGAVTSTGGEIVTVLGDQLGLFGSMDALQGVEQYQSIMPPSGSRVSLAGVAQSAPAVAAFTLGSGKVVEVGLGGFVDSLADVQSPAHVNSQELMSGMTKLLGGT